MIVAKLKELLEGLDDDYDLVPNQVKNLAIIHDRKYLGFIDFTWEDVYIDHSN